MRTAEKLMLVVVFSVLMIQVTINTTDIRKLSNRISSLEHWQVYADKRYRSVTNFPSSGRYPKASISTDNWVQEATNQPQAWPLDLPVSGK